MNTVCDCSSSSSDSPAEPGMDSRSSVDMDSTSPVSELRARRNHRVSAGDDDDDGGSSAAVRVDASLAADMGDPDEDDKSPRLSLVDQVLLLGLKDKEGYTSFWNDDISTGLRGAMLVELALRSKIRLEPCGLRRRPLLTRRVLGVDSTPTGDAILDEALRQINSSQAPHSVPTWISLLSGDSWNPFNLHHRIRNVRERIAKNLVDKGICGTSKQNFLVFDMTTHPILPNNEHKIKLVKAIQASVLSGWNPNIRRFDLRQLALIYLAHASDVIDNAFVPLGQTDFELAGKRIRQLIAADPEQEAAAAAAAAAGRVQNQLASAEVMWAVVAALNK